MIYSFHHCERWAKGGIETGQVYRAKIFRKLGVEAKFIFATAFPEHNIWDEILQLGFQKSEVIWLYGFFADCKSSQSTYTLEQLESTFDTEYIFTRKGSLATYRFMNTDIYYNVFLMDDLSNIIYRVGMFSNGCLVRKDYYTYCRIYSEYYIPVDGYAIPYLKRYFNEDGSVAYEEMTNGGTVLYKFKDRLLYSREEMVEDMISHLNLTKDDVVLIDGEPGIIDRAAFVQSAFPAKIGFVIHSNHFRDSDEEHVLWYDFFEYALSHLNKISFYVTNTTAQSNLLREQLCYYNGVETTVETVPVAYLDKIRIPQKERRKHSLMTAGRLWFDKRVNWIIEAAVIAKRQISDLTLDIYGEGDDENILRELINKLNCGDYVHLCGFQKLDEIYQNYEVYVSASYGETFGITLLEAVGSGLPIIGFDRPYGIQNFVDEGENGFRISDISVNGLADGIIRIFTEAKLEEFRKRSYEKAQDYLEDKVAKKWEKILNDHHR